MLGHFSPVGQLLTNYRNYSMRYIRDPKLGHRVGRNSVELELVRDGKKLYWAGSSANGFYGQNDSRLRGIDDETDMLNL